MKLLGLPENVLKELADYLATKPINEAATLYNAVKNVYTINGPDGNPLQVPEVIVPEVTKEEVKQD